MAGFPLKDLASALGVQIRTIRIYIRKGWIEAKPIRWRKSRKQPGMMAVDWVIPAPEYRKIIRDGLRPPSDTFDAIERANAHKVEVA